MKKIFMGLIVVGYSILIFAIGGMIGSDLSFKESVKPYKQDIDTLIQINLDLEEELGTKSAKDMIENICNLKTVTCEEIKK